ncbi:MAG: hypothetical protein WCW02_03805 [Candidatus Buchananbacteria bacterium]
MADQEQKLVTYYQSPAVQEVLNSLPAKYEIFKAEPKQLSALYWLVVGGELALEDVVDFLVEQLGAGEEAALEIEDELYDKVWYEILPEITANRQEYLAEPVLETTNKPAVANQPSVINQPVAVKPVQTSTKPSANLNLDNLPADISAEEKAFLAQATLEEEDKK